MKSFLIGASLILFSLAAQASENGAVCLDLDLDIPESEAKPVVKVAPILSKGNSKHLPTCIVVSFVLVAKPGSQGKALIPGNLKIEGSTDKAWKEPVKAAVSKWLYLSRGIEYRGRQYIIYRIPALTS
ncbi:hypothetical protein MO867_20765 [Microbulbifer sp. OS29]|uniref:Uncharacterized protein n=1 Tax=Microbulbifer okhotskensis TaxID=2926617 RepID=A0A9X2J714_9GAMM|nr:hypothetical protein [Microbulbifer okhotskensis]MCO1336763.1 hypothetical protein [Microbulbifer okhotskensis]